MIGHMAIEPEPAEPPVRQIEVDLFAEAPLGADAEAVADDEHPDHQLGINRWPAQCALERGQLPPDPAKLHESVNRAREVIVRNVSFEREPIEQSSLVVLPMSHHDLQP
jgi:hypothetical protein